MPEKARWKLTSLFGHRLWLALAATPSSYLTSASLVATIVAKLVALSTITSGRTDWLTRLTVLAPACAVSSALGALLTAGEQIAIARKFDFLKWAARALALSVAIFTAFNCAYLSVTGDQLTASIVAMGWQRFRDAYGILLEELRRHEALIGGAVLLFLAIPWLARWILKRSSSTAPTPHPALPLALLSLLAGVTWLLLPAPQTLPLARLARSAVLTTYVTWVKGSTLSRTESQLGRVEIGPLIEPGSKQYPSKRYNVVVVVIESLRHDYASLSPKARGQTPNFAELARRGAWTDSARTPLPHTTKALFAVHCGHTPFFQAQLHELNDHVKIDCLGHLLQREGYATGFFQSAIGAFEDRPRLVHRLGFSHFEAWENIVGEPLGYLASDDLSLAPALDRWLDKLPAGQPFLATLMTSATHHPYRLPNADLARMQAEGTDISAIEAEARYAILVKRADALLGNVVASLSRRGLLDHTLVVALGDHGEGFGEKGVRQHDNNYYEESLRVPLAIAGPGVQPRELPAGVSILDITPTLLALLGFETIPRNEAKYGRNALSSFSGPRTLLFSCFYDGVCFGYVRGNEKVVVLPELQRAMSFDLANDPEEVHARQLRLDSPQLNRLAMLKPGLVLSGGTPYPYLEDLRFPNGWLCPKGDYCRHPKTPLALFFTPAIPGECVKVKSNAVPTANGYDHVLSLTNLCSGATVCEVTSDTKQREKESIQLQPEESRDLVLQHDASDRDFKYAMDCQFL